MSLRSRRPGLNNVGDNLASWDSEMSKADFVVAQDGSGNYQTINEAVDALGRLGQNRPERVVVYVKSGVYREKVEIGRDLKNIMFIGDGIDKTPTKPYYNETVAFTSVLYWIQ
ncbi:plant invertase/pectin methylesterase inhibitor [Striga asiatica]|uniref:Plant invertase/pectin methylesterase inhibitor n=1 Tax=Striga asiatica TaxID=4170 RepID=A0A5A7RK55_STRAF|nr:plant invertase/pectin methylesterase inhibitor [Striga asiatica]